MPKAGSRTTYKYSDRFKTTAVRLSELPASSRSFDKCCLLAKLLRIELIASNFLIPSLLCPASIGIFPFA